MNLKKRIICAILCSALIIPVSATIAENSNNIVISTIVSADDTDGDYLASVDISVPRETYIYGESAVFTIGLTDCKNLLESEFTISYTSSLTFLNSSILQGQGNVTVDETNHTITVSLKNADHFTTGGLFSLAFKTPEQPVDEDDSQTTCSINIDDTSFSGDNGHNGGSSYSPYKSIYVSDCKNVVSNSVRYAVYKDHAAVISIDEDCPETVEIPATIENVPVTDFSKGIFPSDTVKMINVDPENQYLASKDGVVFNKDFTELILYPMGNDNKSYSVPSTVKTIRQNAFWPIYTTNPEEIALSDIYIPESVTNMEDNCINFHEKIMVIHGYENTEAYRYAKENYMTFYNMTTNSCEAPVAMGVCGENLTWKLDSNGLMTISGTGDMTEFLQQKNCAETPWYSFTQYIKEIVVEDGVTSISNDAFAWCNNLTKVTLADSVTLLDYQAFYYCPNLTEIKMPANLREIGQECFLNCGATSIELPKSLLYIRAAAFSQSNLKEIDIPKSVKEISSAFANCPQLVKVTIDPDSQYLSMYKGVLYDKYQTEILIIPVTLETLTLPDTMTNFGYISGEHIKTLNISSGLNSIDMFAFENLRNLENINVVGNNSSFSSENGVLYNKDKTEIISYPIGKKDAIYIMPKTVTSIEPIDFNYIYNFTDLYYAGSESDLTVDEYLNGHFKIHYNSSPVFSKGDFNGDGVSSASDILIFKNNLAGFSNLSAVDKSLLDINGDWSINALDLLKLKRDYLKNK